MGDLSDFGRGVIVGVRLVAVSEVMSAYTNHRQHQRRGTWPKINADRKGSSYIEKDCFETSRRNCCSTGDRTAELNIHLEDPVSTKTVRRELHRSNTHGRDVTPKPLITESNAQIGKRWCHDHKSWTSDKWKRARHMVK
jgi:hypothetical protein